jgi:hypothetical protein
VTAPEIAPAREAPTGQVEQPLAPTTPSAAPKAAPEVTTVVVHRSEIYASVVGRRGKVVELLSLLMTSETVPAPGTKAQLFRKAGKKESGDWIPLGEVTLQKFGDGGKIEILLGGDAPGGKAEIYKKDLAIKLQIDR